MRKLSDISPDDVEDLIDLKEQVLAVFDDNETAPDFSISVLFSAISDQLEILPKKLRLQIQRRIEWVLPVLFRMLNK